MKKIIMMLLAVLLLATGCSSTSSTTSAETKTGKANGFGGLVEVTVTLEGDKITGLDVSADSETPNIGGAAIETLTAAILESGSVDVEMVSGATVTSTALINAINNALDPEAYPFEEPAQPTSAPVEEVSAADLTMGTAVFSTGRLGPGSDDTDTPVYSFNEVYASVLFDAEGKIVDMYLDQLEVATPNYDGDGMPHFTGFPGQSYNYDEDHDAKVDGTQTSDEDMFMAEINSWATKRERGDSYSMGTGKWYQQADKYEDLFVGMSVEEVEDWFNKYCSDANGRPLQEGSEAEGDAEKYAALSDDEKAMLADVTSSATMSLNDGHGNIIGAILKAYEVRKPVNSGEIVKFGLGLSNTGRVGPGSDDTDTPVYSFNQVFASGLFDAEGKIVSLNLDQLEIATPNYDGEGMPHFTGFPGQSYNYDEDHDAKVDGTQTSDEDMFMAEINSWATKRERGDSYSMGTGKWYQQADKYEDLFVGMTVEEVEDWFNKYCSDANGRPLQETSEAEGDAEKYAALSDDEKAMLADVTSSATMSLNDSHGNILAAIKDAYEASKDVDIVVE